MTYLTIGCQHTCPLKSMTKALTCLISSFSFFTNCSTVSRSVSTSSPSPVCQNSLLHLIAVFLPGVSITVTGFPSSPFHLIYQFIRTKDFQSLSQPYPNIAFSATLVYNGAFYRSKRRSNMLRCKPSGLGTGVFGDTLSPLSGYKALAAVRVFLILKVVSPT